MHFSPSPPQSQIQNRAVPTVRGGRRVQVRRQVPVCARHAGTAQPPASSKVQDRAVPHVPQRRLLPIRPTLSLCAQRRGSPQPQPLGGGVPRPACCGRRKWPKSVPGGGSCRRCGRSTAALGRANSATSAAATATPAAAQSGPVHVDRFGPRLVADRIAIAVADHVDGQLLPRAGQPHIPTDVVEPAAAECVQFPGVASGQSD